MGYPVEIAAIDILDEEKLQRKHGVTRREVIQVFANEPRFFWAKGGQRPHEDVYTAWGQTDGGRYLIVFFIYKLNRRALVTSARDMDGKERKRYGKK